MSLNEVKSLAKFNAMLVETKNEIPKYFITFFYCIHAIYSMDFGFISYKSTRHKIVKKISSITMSFFICACGFAMMIAYQKVEKNFKPWVVKCLIENLSHVVILTLTPRSKSFYMFIKNLQMIDAKFGVNFNSYRLYIQIIICCFVSFLTKILAASVFCLFFNDFYCRDFIVPNFMVIIPYMSWDYPLIMFYFVFHGSRLRLVMLRNLIKENKFKPKYFQLLYKLLIECTENAKKAFDPLVSLFKINNI